MSEKKIFTRKELETLSPETIIDRIQHENYSLLKTLGGEKLRKEMVPVGKVCHTAVKFFLRKGPEKAQKLIVKDLRRLAPAKYSKNLFPKDTDEGIVIGFNHPSLGEILRIVLAKTNLIGEKPMLFPVNLPWYEAIAPDYDMLKSIGIIITPTITPSTWKKLNLSEKDKLFEPANRLKRAFRDIYTDLSHENVKNGGIIFVAPSATRQTTVFKTPEVYDKKEDIIPTMSILALKLYADPKMHCSFLPIAVLPPKKYKRGLNLFKTYELKAGKLFTEKEIKKAYFKEKNPKRLDNFDYDFHMRIAEKLPKNFWY